MPGMIGRDLFLRIRALHTRFPILLLSASASTLCPDDCVLFYKCLDKGEPVRRLLDLIAAFLDPNEISDVWPLMGRALVVNILGQYSF
jgi:hypothetical protein